MRRCVALSIGSSCLVFAGLATAGPFGGFSADGQHYLVEATRVCQPVAAGQATPQCEKKSAEEVARLGFRKGTLQRGPRASVAVQASGTRITVRSADGKSVRAEWDSGNPVGQVSAVYLSDDGKQVAIEYEARQAGRSAPQAVVLSLAAAQGTPASPTVQAAAPAPDDPKVVARLRVAERELGRKKWKKAEEEYRGALAMSADHPAARYGLAAALAGQSRAADAVAELTALARSIHPQAPRWLVEARLGPHFTRLQGDPGFRRAVGIDRDPARQPSAYERLVGQGGHWEQTGLACQDPTVDLRLDRKSEKFQLSIRNRCQGDDETTRLAGIWKSEGAAILRLQFPNVDGPEENLECRLASSSDRSSEDALTCELEDLRFTMRVVRR